MLKSKLHSANESCLKHLHFKVHGCTAKKEHGKAGNEAAFQFKKSEPEMQKAFFLVGWVLVMHSQSDKYYVLNSSLVPYYSNR